MKLFETADKQHQSHRSDLISWTWSIKPVYLTEFPLSSIPYEYATDPCYILWTHHLILYPTALSPCARASDAEMRSPAPNVEGGFIVNLTAF
jgi:hypothetical protein